MWLNIAFENIECGPDKRLQLWLSGAFSLVSVRPMFLVDAKSYMPFSGFCFFISLIEQLTIHPIDFPTLAVFHIFLVSP